MNNIQSLSIMVPCGGHCMNNCKFCVSRMRNDISIFGPETISAANIPQSYIDRIKYVRDAGCDNMIITGTTEPQQNRPFIMKLLEINSKLDKPFYNIAIQTTGAGMDEKDIESLAFNGINTLALSIASFNMECNWDIIQTPKAARKLSIEQLISVAKANNMNVRACLNMNSAFNDETPESIFAWAVENKVDQITFRKLYRSNIMNCEQDKWIIGHQYKDKNLEDIKKYIKLAGTPIRILPFGATLYDCCGIGVVIDEDCMAKKNLEDMRYAILRPNNHLYSSWDLKGSLIY